MTSTPTIDEAIRRYLHSVALARSANTVRTYQNGMAVFRACLEENELPPDETPLTAISEETIVPFANALKDYAPATERLYLTAASGFFEFLAAERLVEINLPRLRLLIRQRARRSGVRLPQFPRNAIESVLEYAINIALAPAENLSEQLRNLRDRAFLFTLADTGLRVHEACALRRGDLDWFEHRAVLIGKGNREAVVRFSTRSITYIREYLKTRQELDGLAGKSLTALPLFARHDRGAGKKIKPISTATGRNIVAQRVKEALGEEAAGTITPHSFRHYFVTAVLRGSGGNLKLAQELARHQNIAVTQRYAHLSDDELDRGYSEIFDNDKH
jgi:site-specific recombinase XerD